MRRIVFSLTLILTAGSILFAQESKTVGLSLQECVQMAVEKNINMKTARIDQEKSVIKKDEARSALLPKVNFSGNFTDNLKLPTTVLPGEFLGKPGTTIPVQMGVQYSAVGMLSISQIIFRKHMRKRYLRWIKKYRKFGQKVHGL